MLTMMLRGGATEPSFNFDLANARLEGLGYDIVAALILNAALQLFSSTPRAFEPIPDDALDKKARIIKFVSLSI